MLAVFSVLCDKSMPLYCPSPFHLPTSNCEFVLSACFFFVTFNSVVFFILHINTNICLTLSDLFHLALIPSRSIHVVADGKVSFSFYEFQHSFNQCHQPFLLSTFQWEHPS